MTPSLAARPVLLNCSEDCLLTFCDSVLPPALLGRDVKREVFLGFADYYITTAKEIGTRLEGQLMTVNS